MFATAIINARAAKKIAEGYPWVYERDLISRRFQTAGIVGITDKRGRFLGQGFYSPRSKISLRVITRSKEKIDALFWKEKIRKSLSRRAALAKSTDALRVAYAESDGLPSIIIDKYNDIVSFQITSAGAETVKRDIVLAIKELLRPMAIVEKNNVEIRRREGLELMEGMIEGDKKVTMVTEGDCRFEVNVLRGQKTGAYLDYRALRLKAEGFCRSEGTALDVFCYQGWMACQIAKKCARVVAVDASPDAISAACRNAELNGHANIEFICGDAFKFLEQCADKFDFVHLDPPPFAKGRENLSAAIKGYKKLNIAAMKRLKAGGIFFTSSCSYHISEGLLEKTVKECAREIGSRYDVVYRGMQDKDHPVLKGFPESLYLKAIMIKI